MLKEILSLLSSADVGNVKGTFDVSLNKRRIHSISSFSSNSIFYFPVVVSDQCTLEEVTMISRALEKQYATFVVSCISLMPFHRIRSDDQASVENYLQQFHQNIGIKGQSKLDWILGEIDALEEHAVADAAREFFATLYENARANDENLIVHLRENYQTLSEMYGADALDDYTKVLMNRYALVNEEMNTWGFIGDEVPDYYSEDDLDDDDEDYDDDELDDALLSEAAGVERGKLRPLIRGAVCLRGLEESVNVNIDCHCTMNEDGTGYCFNRYPTLATFDIADCPKELLENICADIKAKSPIRFRDVHTEIHMDADGEPDYGEIVAMPEEEIQKRLVQIPVDKVVAPSKPVPGETMLLNGGSEDFDSIDESVKSAISKIKFQIESVPDNKIKSCPSLMKLRTLESKLKTLKNKYAKYLKRYKRKYNENKKNGTKQKLAIRFSGMMIDNPKAFMKQYGTYIKIINKKLKLVEKRRSELRAKKGIQESALDTDFDYTQLDYLIETMDYLETAPDNKIFALNEQLDPKGQYWYDEGERLRQAEERANRLADIVARDKETVRTANSQIAAANSARDSAIGEARKQRDRADKATEEATKAKNRATSAINSYRSQSARIKAKDEEIKAKTREIEELKKAAKNSTSSGSSSSGTEVNVYRNKRFSLKDRDPNDTSLRGPRDNIVAGRAVQGPEFRTFDKAVFTDMEMKKANDMIPTYTKANIGFIVDETEEVVSREVLIGIKTYVHRAPTGELVEDLYDSIISRRKFLKFVKFISGEEKSLADLLFGIKELKLDATRGQTKQSKWKAAFQRRKRWKNMSIPYLTKEYTPNGTVVMTMREVDYIKEQYGIDLMMMEHIHMLMDTNFLLGFVILDQANEIVHVTYDGFGYQFQEYAYAQLEREQANTDRMMRELYRSFSRG